MFKIFYKKPKVYLIGGFFINPNYGDILQAKTWVDYYSKNNYEVNYIYSGNLKDIKTFKFYLGKLKYITDKEILESNNIKGNFVHFYGGGYLNSLWGLDFLKIIKHLSKNNKIIFTGEQVDSKWAYYYNQEIVDKDNVKWISFRDSESASFIKDDSVILDDSLIYFNKLKKFNNNITENQKVTLLLSINLSNYSIKNFNVSDNFNLEDKRKSNLCILSNFVNNVPKYIDIKLVKNFFFESQDIIEGKALIQLLNIDREIEFISAYDLEIIKFHKALGISSTFHSAILMRYLLGLQVIFIAENDYYSQKAKGLLEMGLLQNRNLINSYKDLLDIDFHNLLAQKPNYFSEDSNIDNKIDKTLKKLNDYLNHVK